MMSKSYPSEFLFGARSEMVNENTEPSPDADSIQIRPPWRSIIRLDVASPMPDPLISLATCRRRNIANALSK